MADEKSKYRKYLEDYFKNMDTYSKDMGKSRSKIDPMYDNASDYYNEAPAPSPELTNMLAAGQMSSSPNRPLMASTEPSMGMGTPQEMSYGEKVKQSLQDRGMVPKPQAEDTSVQDAMDLQNRQMLMANLGQAGGRIGAAIAGIKPENEYWDTLRGQTGTELKTAIADKEKKDKLDLMEKQRVQDMKDKKDLIAYEMGWKQKLEESKPKKVDLKPVPETAVTKISDYENGVNMLDDMMNVVGTNKDMFGRYGGVKSSVKSFFGDEETQFVESQLEKTKQFVGKALEGGVLRKEDTEKYNRILGNMFRNPASLNESLKVLKADLDRNRNDYVKNLTRAKYDTELFDITQNNNNNKSKVASGTNTPTQQGDGATIERMSKDGRVVIYDAVTKKPLRYK